VVGYPARATRRVIPDQEEVRRHYRDCYEVKRAAPGIIMASTDETLSDGEAVRPGRCPALAFSHAQAGELAGPNHPSVCGVFPNSNPEEQCTEE
jgi:hypothetical protein